MVKKAKQQIDETNMLQLIKQKSWLDGTADWMVQLID